MLWLCALAGLAHQLHYAVKANSTLAVLQTRAEPLGIELVVADPAAMDFGDDSFGLLLQLPGFRGLRDHETR